MAPENPPLTLTIPNDPRLMPLVRGFVEAVCQVADLDQATTDIMGYMGTRLLADRENTGHYVLSVDFGVIDPDISAADEATRNNERPETQAFAARLREVVDGELEVCRALLGKQSVHENPSGAPVPQLELVNVDAGSPPMNSRRMQARPDSRVKPELQVVQLKLAALLVQDKRGVGAVIVLNEAGHCQRLSPA